MNTRLVGWTSVAILALLAGCATRQVVHIEAAPVPVTGNLKFVDDRTSAFKVSFLLGSGNVYSCHYGISEIDSGAMNPNRMVLLHSYLANKVFADGKPHTVVVKRFDIYWNRHLHMEGHMFGAVGKSVSSSGEVVGCKGDQEGEYFHTEVPGPNYSPIVIYLNALVDGKRYSVRTVTPLLESPSTEAEWPNALKGAIEGAFGTLGSVVVSDEGIENPSSGSDR